MTAPEVLEHRIAQLEKNVQRLSEKVNGFAVSQAATAAKLDNMLITLGELKESISGLNKRPIQFWDKLLLAILSAAATAFVAFLIK